MHVIVVSQRRLLAKYGPQGQRQLTVRIAGLRHARQRRGLQSCLLDVEQGAAAYGVGGVDGSNARAISMQLAALDTALKASGDRVESVLIIGGPDVVPFHLGRNPVADSDSSIAADYLYGRSDADGLLNEWPVGRLPDGEGTSAGQLRRLLLLASLLQCRPPVGAARTFGYSTASWRRASGVAYAVLNPQQPLLLSPPTTAGTLDTVLLDGAGRVYCNLHGSPSNVTWYGQGPTRHSKWISALRPRDVAPLNMLGAVVVSEACYGAYSPDCDLGDGLAMAFMLRGAACFVGTTTMAYGPSKPPLSEADLLARTVLEESLRPGITAGEAFAAARRRVLLETMDWQGFLDEDDTKTLMQFVLYGDPTLVIGAETEGGDDDDSEADRSGGG